jgi:DNA-binding MarR family transcriptional regulator
MEFQRDLKKIEMSDFDIASLFLEIVPKAMREIRIEMRRSRDTELTVPQFRILAHLWREPTNLCALAESQGVSGAAMSRMVDWLAKHLFVEKVQDQIDRRLISVQLTAHGKKSFEMNRHLTRVSFEKRIQSLSMSEKKKLAAGLSSIKEAINRMNQS